MFEKLAKLFKGDEAGATPPAKTAGVKIRFGRFNDAFKPQHKLDKWTESDNAFKAQEYLKSYLAFFDYIKDDEQNNVKYRQEGDKIIFDIQQGSKAVHGTASAQGIEAYASIALMEKSSVAAMRRVLEHNFRLYYSRFSLRENTLTIRYDASVAGGNPHKLYYALKEMATTADTQDDLMTQEFAQQLKPTDSAETQPFPPDEAEIKYKYLLKWVQDTSKRIDGLNAVKDSGAISWLLMALTYRIDYLITPQGKLMSTVEDAHRIYYAKDNRAYEDKNREIKALFEKIIAQPKENVLRDFYRAKTTFAVTQPSGPNQLLYAIDDATGGYYGWADKGYQDVALGCAEHAATYTLFNYSVPKPVHEMLNLLVNVLQPDFYKEMNADGKFFDAGNNTFNRDLVSTAIKGIVNRGKAEFPSIMFDISKLNYKSRVDFCYSFLLELRVLAENFTKPQQ
jgi:hypothetical protein